jgi:signal transduction histidine kinase
VLSALERRHPAAGAAIRALEAVGAPFDIAVAAPGGVLRLTGRTSGALALITLALEPPTASAPLSPWPPTSASVAPPLPRSAATRRQAAPSPAMALTLGVVADAVAIFGPDRRLAYHNDAFARLWGLGEAWLAEGPSHGALLDRLRQDGRLPGTADYGRFKTEELARHERLDPAPEAIWRVAGERLLRVRSLPHPAGGLILVTSDITPEVRLNSQFNHLLQVRQATLDKLNDAVAVFGPDARLKLHNEAFVRLWELPPEILAPEAAFDDIVDRCVALLHDRQFWRQLKARISDPDPGVRAAAQGEAATGDGRSLAWQSRPLPDAATLVSFVDVTARRRLEWALRDREAALDAAEQLKRDFVAGVSHELRTPLTTILGYAELLEASDEALSPRARGWVAAVRAAAGDLAGLVDDVLAFAEIDGGEMSLQLADLPVTELLAGAQARWAGRAAAAAVALEVAALGDPGRLRADPGRLARVLDHLVDHALRQTPAGGRVVVTARRAAGEVCLTVADSGRGIPFHVQPHVFDRFSGEEGAGAGLGLALVKALVELHGGWVDLESEPGAGATFACHLPEAGPPEDARGRF